MSQENTTEAAPSSQPRKRKHWLLGLVLMTLIILGSGYAYHEFYGQYYESTEDAYVQGNLVSIAPRVNGTVTQVYAESGDYVKQGQPLVTLDPSETRIALDRAEANLGNVIRQTRGLYNDVDNYQAQVQVKEVNYQQAQADYERRRKLAEKGAIAEEEVTHYRDALNAARNELMSTRQALKAKRALTDHVDIAQHPAIKEAIAQLQNAYLNNQYTQIKAPVSGYVAKRSVQLGQQVSTGSDLMVVVPLHQVWIDANFKESQLTQMRIGQPVDITTDLYGDDVHFEGHISSLGIGTGSAFALLPPQNATGNWIKIVQRLPVRIELNTDKLEKYPLRIGLSSTVTVHMAQEGLLLPEQATTTARLTTDIYQNQLQDAHALVAHILSANGIDADKALAMSAAEAEHE
ncbi:hemolysin D [Terasakiispira papahanaumokuakeensis]|uniref:Hemolysin D n=1 Tax=Terasakiispira papahanaumokuakeensis TaxID=197479 RepID=A0A1E2VBN9_9GAMM|nr:efflux RND transporter periplasmic adaptor subunit [Terasakiispira papahanaumokuakeensis]ODC04085.1 hemolysin D [Terasakiispira papahanaumokuakeensis]